MLTRRRNQLFHILNEAALALIDEAKIRGPEDAASMAELATRIDQMRVGLIAEAASALEIENLPLRPAA